MARTELQMRTYCSRELLTHYLHTHLALPSELTHTRVCLAAGMAGAVSVAPLRGEDGDADEETPAASRKRASEKEDEDENEEADEENREGKLRFAGACLPCL